MKKTIPILAIISLLVFAGCLGEKGDTSTTQETTTSTTVKDKKSCEKNSDCVLLEFRCCPKPDPCENKPVEALNKESKEKIVEKKKQNCSKPCPEYAPPACSHCLNLENYSAVCLDNKCKIKKEINCKAYCKALAKNNTETCPFISDPDLITEKNTKKCNCLE